MYSVKAQPHDEDSDEELRRDVSALERWIHELLPTLRGEFIAICGGEKVDQDSNEDVLAQGFYRAYPNQSLVIEQVSEDALEPHYMPTNYSL